MVDAVLSYARVHNVTKIVAGKPLRPHWRDLVQGSVVDQLIRGGGAIDIHVVNSGAGQTPSMAPRTRIETAPWTRYAQSVGLVAGATLLSVALHSTLHLPIY